MEKDKCIKKTNRDLFFQLTLRKKIAKIKTLNTLKLKRVAKIEKSKSCITMNLSFLH